MPFLLAQGMSGRNRGWKPHRQATGLGFTAPFLS